MLQESFEFVFKNDNYNSATKNNIERIRIATDVNGDRTTFQRSITI